ncbi:hypothetical protein ACFE04_021055 [Oxalis oulophora]
MGLSTALLICSASESCFQFVNSGGMDQLGHIFGHGIQNSAAITLLLLGVIEQATRHSIGCEGFLGWWCREDENVPSGISEGYRHLLKLLLQQPRHDIASHATYVLHRLRVYEVASRYECAVLSFLGNLSAESMVTRLTLEVLSDARSQINKLSKLINALCPIDDPSLVARASRSLILGQTEGLFSYKATSKMIGSSKCFCLSNWDIDSHLLALLKERGFLPLSAALLSSSILRSDVGAVSDIFMDIASSIGAIILSLLSCHSGIVFLLHHPQLSATIIHALRGVNDVCKEECLPLRYASVLISKGFACGPREVGMIIEIHLRVLNAIDRLLTATPQSEEFLWVLWELCGLSRSDCGREALFTLRFFPKAVSVLIEALYSIKESDPVTKNGASPISLAIFHSTAEIFEVIVTDTMASSLDAWIGHAMELHKAMYTSSPGSNRKDAPSRLLEWIDAASGGDAHSSSTNTDLTDVENLVGDSANDINIMDNLGKLISEKAFDGLTLRDSSVVQLTTALRILAFVSEKSTIATALYDEGAITVIYAVLVNCRFMLERSSNYYDYLVDEGAECNSTSDILLERNREKLIVDVLVPSLLLLITLLQKLQDAKEQHRNTKLMNALLRLHREVSPKLCASATDLSSPFPDYALGLGAVCHLIASALAFWPVHGWGPGLFHSLLASVQATSLLVLGPVEICSVLCLLNNLFSEEAICLWKNGMPLMSGLRTLAVGTLLGPQIEKQVDWYLDHGPREKLISQLTPQLDKIALIIHHYAISSLIVIQDMLRVFIVRITCQNPVNASVLVRPILLWIHAHVSDSTMLSETDTYKVYRYLDFLSSLLEHPRSKALLLTEGVLDILVKVLEKCYDGFEYDAKQISDSRSSTESGIRLINWCLPAFKSILLLSHNTCEYPAHKSGNLNTEDFSLIVPHLLKFFEVLPVGKELVFCLSFFKEVASTKEFRRALISILLQNSIEELETEKGHAGNGKFEFRIEFEGKNGAPLLCCWKKLLKSVALKDDLESYAIEGVHILSLGSFLFCIDGKSLNSRAVVALKYLFGVRDDPSEIDDESSEKNINYIQELISLLSLDVSKIDIWPASDTNTVSNEVLEKAKSLLLLLQKPTHSVTPDDLLLKDVLLSSNDTLGSLKLYQIDGSVDDLLSLGWLENKFSWECPETLPDRLSQSVLPSKRKMPPSEVSGRRGRENLQGEASTQNTFTRGSATSLAPPGPTRRDTFRLRKPNSSRPTSLHVDDYVARERGFDSLSNSNAITVQRLGSSGGRPPSIHVDQFMARERERQNLSSPVAGDMSSQVKNMAPTNGADVEKPKQLKTDLDDDLQGIDIVFDAEEAEPDDRLPFPHADENLAPVVLEQRSPQSIVEETESDANEGCQFSRMGVDDNTQSEYSSRMSVSRPELSLTREPSVSSEKKFVEQADELRDTIPVKSSGGFGNAAPLSSPQMMSADSRRNNYYQRNSPPVNVRGHYHAGPPLPSVPPPVTFSTVMPDSFQSQASGPPPLQVAFQGTSEFSYSRNSPGSSRLGPALPSTPPLPFSYNINNNSSNMALLKTQYNQTSAVEVGQSSNVSMVYPPSPLMPPMIYNRPSFQPIPPQLQPLQPPQVPRPPQHPRPPPQHHQSDPFQNPVHHQQMSQVTYQSQQHQEFSHAHQQQLQVEAAQLQVGEISNQAQQQDSDLSLHEYFKSPEAIQSLLNDHDKLCQILEHHPKLMQMLQDRLGQL